MKLNLYKRMYVPKEFRVELQNIMITEDLHSKSEAFRKAAKYAVIGREAIKKDNDRKKKNVWYDERF
jgi:hypothetical protein